MPPKDKGKNDQKKPADVEPTYSDVNVCWKREKEAEAAAAKAGQIDDDTKNQFLKEIGELQHRVERLQLQCDKLEVANSQFPAKLKQAETDELEYLRNLVAARDDEIIPLKARLVNLEAEKVRQDEELASKVKTAEESLQSAKDTLNAESILLQNKLTTLKALDEERTDILKTLYELEATRRDRNLAHVDAMYLKERQHNMECQYARRELPGRLDAVAGECIKDEERRMKALLKTEMIDSSKLYSYLTNKVQPKLGPLMDSNSRLKTRIASLDTYDGVVRDYTDRVSRRHQQKVLKAKTLTENIMRLNDDLAEAEGSYRNEEKKFVELTKELDKLDDELQTNSAGLVTLMKENDNMTSELRHTMAELVQADANNKQMASAFSQTCSELDQLLTKMGHRHIMDKVRDVMEMYSSLKTTTQLK